MKKTLCMIAITTIMTGCASEPAADNASTRNSDGSITIHFGGGDGSSIKNAITLIGANSEMAGIGGESLWAQQYLPGWQKIGQELITDGHKSYDAITYQSSEGKQRKIYFDISNFFGKLW